MRGADLGVAFQGNAKEALQRGQIARDQRLIADDVRARVLVDEAHQSILPKSLQPKQRIQGALRLGQSRSGRSEYLRHGDAARVGFFGAKQIQPLLPDVGAEVGPSFPNTVEDSTDQNIPRVTHHHNELLK
jgi:hypothetical protein